MKKILMTLAHALTTMCANAKGAKTPVFAWSGWGENTTEKSLTADFKVWKKHGVTGVCINAGMDVVDAIARTPRSMFNDKPTHEQKMKTVTVETFGVEYPEPETC